MSPEPIRCRALARQLDLDATKVNRLLRPLAYLGITRQTANRKYITGPGMHVLAAQSLFASGLIRRSLPALLQRLEDVRRDGYVRFRVHSSEDRHTIAIAVGDPVYAGIGISGWLPEAASPDLLAALTEAANEIAPPRGLSNALTTLRTPTMRELESERA